MASATGSRRSSTNCPKIRSEATSLPWTLVVLLAICSPDFGSASEAPQPTPPKATLHVQGRHLCGQNTFQLVESMFANSTDAAEMALSAIHKVQPTGVWLQIGSNVMDFSEQEGLTPSSVDPLLKYVKLFQGYRKIFVEPIPSLYAQLEQNVKVLPNATTLNLAIMPADAPDAEVAMYCFPKELWNEWRTGSCSFSEQKIEKELGQMKQRGELQDNVTHTPAQVMVKGTSLAKLLSQNLEDLSQIEVFMVDAEGYDYQIMLQVPFGDEAFRPKLIVYEHQHMSDEQRNELKAVLHSHCYIVAETSDNTFGLAAVTNMNRLSKKLTRMLAGGARSDITA